MPRLTYDNISYNYASATTASPIEVTGLIPNSDFGCAAAWWTRTQTSVGNQQYGLGTMESWTNNNVSVTQELTDIPNGLYKLTVDMISANDDKTAYVYAKGDAEVTGEIVSAKSSADNYTTMSNEVAENTLTANNIHVTNNTITVGFKAPTGWIVADNFKLYYCEPSIDLIAVEFPANGVMVADKWYYIDMGPGKFDISATTFEDIVYTTNGALISSDVTTNFSGTTNQIFLENRYYVKSSSNNQLTFTETTVIPNGTYYFKRNGTETYLTRGGNYGTENVTDKFGLSFEATLQSDGTYTLKNVDHSLVAEKALYLNEQYTDQENAYKWTIEAVEGGYVLKRANGNYVTTTEEPTWHYNYMSNAADKASAIVWTILTKSEYQAALTARKNTEAAAIATAANTEATTEAELIAKLINGEDKTSSITNASLAENVTGWTAVSYESQRRNQDNSNDVIRFNGGAEVWNYVGGAKQTIASLPEGIYKVTVKAVWRVADATDATRAGSEANVTAWMYATANNVTNYTQLKSWADHQVADNAALHASTNDEYVNTVYVYVPSGQDLTIGLASPSWCGVPWMPFYDWTLTRYDATATAAQKAALASAISTAEAKTIGFEKDEYAPYNNKTPMEKLAEAKAVNVETATNAEVVAATTALTGATWNINKTELNAFYDGNFSLNAPVADATGGVGGWSAAEGLRQLVKSGVEGSIVSTGMYVWGSNTVTYGETTGYTVPLKANKVYALSYDRASWESSTHTDVTVKNPAGTTMGTIEENGDAGKWNETGGTLVSQTFYFATSEAGNYTFSFTPWGNTVYTNINLVSADALEFADGSLPAYIPGTYPSVKVTRTLTANRWATAIYPFSVSTTTGVNDVVTLSGFSDGTISFTSGASTANKPFLMRSTAGATDFTLSNVAVAAASPVAATSGDASMIGTYTEIASLEAPAEGKIYVLSNNTLYPLGANAATIDPYRAYIQTAKSSDAKLRFVIDGEEASGIESIIANKEMLDGPVFDLSGRAISKPTKGLYIMNGKKVLVK